MRQRFAEGKIGKKKPSAAGAETPAPVPPTPIAIPEPEDRLPTPEESNEASGNNFLRESDWDAICEDLDEKGVSKYSIQLQYGCNADELARFIAKMRQKDRQEAQKKELIKPPEENRIRVNASQYIGARHGTPLQDTDWMDIKHRYRLLGHSKTTLAGDYDVSEDEMDAFIRKNLAAERLKEIGDPPPPGEG